MIRGMHKQTDRDGWFFICCSNWIISFWSKWFKIQLLNNLVVSSLPVCSWKNKNHSTTVKTHYKIKKTHITPTPKCLSPTLKSPLQPISSVPNFCWQTGSVNACSSTPKWNIPSEVSLSNLIIGVPPRTCLHLHRLFMSEGTEIIITV